MTREVLEMIRNGGAWGLFDPRTATVELIRRTGRIAAFRDRAGFGLAFETNDQ